MARLFLQTILFILDIKKINQASYESTEVIIRFNFVLNSGVNGNVSNTLNQRYILCYPTIYTKDYFAIATPGTGYAFAPNGGGGKGYSIGFNNGTNSGAYSNVAGRYILIGQNGISFRPTTIRISDVAQKIHLAGNICQRYTKSICKWCIIIYSIWCR